MRIAIDGGINVELQSAGSNVSVAADADSRPVPRVGALTPAGESEPMDYSSRDLRKTVLWKEIEQLYTNFHEPAFGKPFNIADLQISSDGKSLSVTASVWQKPEFVSNDITAAGALRGMPSTRICLVDESQQTLREVTKGPGNDKTARWHPYGTKLLFLSDRKQKGIFLPFVLDKDQFGEAHLLVNIREATVEYAEWSPDGTRVLLGTAGLDADNAAAGLTGGSGKIGGAPHQSSEDWLPAVESEPKDDQWRKLWVFDTASHQLELISPPVRNYWEAAWAGNQNVVAVSSKQPGEESWYNSDIELLSLHPACRQPSLVERHASNGKPRQFGCPVASPDGTTLAFIDSIASDRGLTAGVIKVARAPSILTGDHSWTSDQIELGSMDVAWIQLTGSSTIAYAAVSGIGFVVGELDLSWDGLKLTSYKHKEIYKSSDGCADPYYPKAAVTRTEEPCYAIISQSRQRPPEIGFVRDGNFSAVHSVRHPGFEWFRSQVGVSQPVSWKSTDGLEIQGILDLPRADFQKPYPLVLHIHGGPVASWQNTWTGWSPIRWLVSRGYAVLSPNPRGSTGRGTAFTEREIGDVGGMETSDHLSGIDHLIHKGLVDANRIGVMGGSHGGFMTSWIVTQDTRFKACVPTAAVNDWHAQHFTSNIRDFDRIFLQESPYRMEREWKYFLRSPIAHVDKIHTPVLQIAGEVDYCVPVSQAKEFHNALLEHGKESVLAVYPGEGHGVRKYPAVIDVDVRTVGWFEKWMPPGPVAVAEN